jgi:myo-inositol-1(or 4)-monophosphatase
MKQEEVKQLCLQSCQIVEEVAGFIRGELGRVKNDQIEVKSLNSLVSYVDKTAEEYLVKAFKNFLPGSTFLTEEATVDQQTGEYRWIIDPLDGTTNFLHQLPCFAVSVALQHHEKTILGIVYEVNQKECFYAWQDGGSFLNDKPIHVSTTSRAEDALIATGFPCRDYSRMKEYFTVFEHLIKNSRGVRRLGASAVDLAYVACGRFDVFFEYGLSPWDVAAGALIVEEAGGRVDDFNGKKNYLFGEEMLAANAGTFAEVQAIIHRVFSEKNVLL